MGGCRCTYRTCTGRSSANTHLFHYPVFDKVRCHQWLINAHKLEFLNLQVRQLRNRVVCQHHFKDEMFMNFKKDRLVCDAIPTEDGPYCLFPDKTTLSDLEDETLFIRVEHIDNDTINTPSDKHNIGLKYGDYLTNCDLMDLNLNTQTPSEPMINYREGSFKQEKHKNSKVNMRSILRSNSLPQSLKNFEVVLKPVSKKKKLTHVSMDAENEPNVNSQIEINVSPDKTTADMFTQQVQHPPSKRRKVHIISEKRITEPPPPPPAAALVPVSPSRRLELPRARHRAPAPAADTPPPAAPAPGPLQTYTLDLTQMEAAGQNTDITLEQVDKRCFIDVPPIQEAQGECTPLTENISLIRGVRTNKVAQQVVASPEKTTNRLTQDRLAAIREKRQFNMKLRDIVSESLNSLSNTNTAQNEATKSTHEVLNQKVNSHLSSNPELPSMQEYLANFLDSRLKRMENNLLDRIDNNSQRIKDLKNTFVNNNKQSSTKPPKQSKYSVLTQTDFSHGDGDEEARKKYLYDEISSYLTPSAKSVIYEELFINNIVQAGPKSSKRRKRR